MPESKTPTSAEVRAWAVSKGLAAAGRGRLSLAAVDAYNRAHKVPYGA